MRKFTSVDEYIAEAEPTLRDYLTQMRAIVRDVAPEAEERISYGMPGYYLRGPLVYIGGFKKHVSLFTAGETIQAQFKQELEGYKMSKGTIQFPLNKPLPTDLIRQLVKARVEQNMG